MIVELHLIQNFAPSCLNRDDTNTPKDCEFGGHRRARISSQCIKRAIRQSDVFSNSLNNIGIRTKLLVNRMEDELQKAGKKKEDIEILLPAFVSNLLSKLDSKTQKTAVLLYLGNDEVEQIKNIILKGWDKLITAAQKTGKGADAALNETCKEIAKDFKGGSKSPDIALFGRMMAEHPSLKTDAACQVAHAISTHKVMMDMDFYTAIDDLQMEDTTGADMMGVIGFNSSCFYRYSLVDLEQLKENLASDEELTLKTLEAFLRASVSAIPTGKQTSMAAQNPPDAIIAVVRNGGTPVSLANAFAVPVRATREKSIVQASIEALDDYWARLEKVYGSNGLKECAVCPIADAGLTALNDYKVSSLEELLKKIIGAVSFAEV